MARLKKVLQYPAAVSNFGVIVDRGTNEIHVSF